MSNTIRIRTTPNGGDNYLKLKLEQDFDFIEILSLKISQEDAYRKFCSDYGVIVGRVIINNGFGVPNAKVSVFIPIDDIDKEDPLGTIGGVIGTSGRQQDMVEEASLKRYDTIVENCSHAFSTTFGMAYRILEKLNHLLPVGIKKDDIGGDYNCRIELKTEDPISADRLRTLGSRLYQQGEIDLETNLTKYQGKTPEQARQIKINILKERILFSPNSPLAQIIAMRAAQKAGMGDELKALMAQTQALETGGKTTTPTEMARGQGEVKTPLGREMVDNSAIPVGARNPPAPYTRQ